MARRTKDLTGAKFGEYTVLKRSCRKKFHWECECSCGTIKPVSTSNLVNGKATRCKSCASRVMRIDHTDKQFGEWKALNFSHADKYSTTYWRCKCSCGTIKTIRTTDLISGKSTKCRSCANVSINKGRPASPETVARLKYYNKNRIFTPEQLRRKSEVQMGEKNSFYGKKHTKETCELLSNINVDRILQNDGVNAASTSSRKGKFYSEKNKCYIKYDSTYEVQAYKLLEKRDDVTSYGRCNFSIKYILNDKENNYIPDIMVIFSNSDKKTIIEIKPKRRLKEQINIVKFKALRVYCTLNNLHCKVWTEQKLFKDNIEYRTLLKELTNEK